MTLSSERERRRERDLRDEVRYLHAALFGGDPPPEIESGYVHAHEYYCAEGADDIDIPVILAHKLDVEAIELALRKRRTALTRKFRILVYLAEVRPSHYGRFVNETDRPARAWFSLCFATLRTIFKYLKGRAILWRHALV